MSRVIVAFQRSIADATLPVAAAIAKGWPAASRRTWVGASANSADPTMALHQPAPRCGCCRLHRDARSEEHTSELQSLMRISYAVFCVKQNTMHNKQNLQLTHDFHQHIDNADQ